MADDRCVCGSVHGSNGCPVLARAARAFGRGAVIGTNAQYPDAPLYVGKKVQGEFKLFGAGRTFDEAFAAVREVLRQRPNGQFEFAPEKKDSP